MRVYLLSVLIISQIIPTFGGMIGSIGNSIPLVFALGGFGLFYILGKGAPSSVFYAATLYTLALCTLGVTSALFSPFLTSLRDASIVIKVLTMHVAFMCGFLYYRDPGDLKPLVTSILFLFAFHVLLYFDHLAAPNGPIQSLYHFKDFGLRQGYYENRFPGTWNFPYNVAVFLFCCFLVIIYKIRSAGDPLKTTLYLGALGLCAYISIFGTQSRSNMVAFFSTVSYALAIYFLYSFVKARFSHFVFSGLLAMGGLVSGLFFFSFILSPEAREFEHLSKLDGIVGQMVEHGRIRDLIDYYHLIAQS